MILLYIAQPVGLLLRNMKYDRVAVISLFLCMSLLTQQAVASVWALLRTHLPPGIIVPSPLFGKIF